MFEQYKYLVDFVLNNMNRLAFELPDKTGEVLPAGLPLPRHGQGLVVILGHDPTTQDLSINCFNI